MKASMKVQGLDQLAAKIKVAPAVVNAASAGATVIGSQILVAEVRSKIRGEPRWGHRGKSKVYHNSITVSDARGNGGGGEYPGKFSGDLIKGVGYRKVPQVRGTVTTGGVGIGKSVNNLKKRYLEEEWPFFQPSVEDTRAEIVAAYEDAWRTALKSAME